LESCRDGFLKSVEGEYALKYVEIVDKSVSQIGDDVYVKKVDRELFLKEVSKGFDNFKKN